MNSSELLQIQKKKRCDKEQYYLPGNKYITSGSNRKYIVIDFTE